jgi:hypothetical protein
VVHDLRREYHEPKYGAGTPDWRVLARKPEPIRRLFRRCCFLGIEIERC